MKSFFIKLAMILVPFILLFFVLNYAYKKSYYWTEFKETAKFKNIPDNIQIANLGSSHGTESFLYEDFPEYTTFNMALAWQHHCYNYYVLKQYADNFAPGAVLLIPISYFDITRIEYEYPYRYYEILSRENFPDWNIKEYLLREILPLLSTNKTWEELANMNNKLILVPKESHTLHKDEDVVFQSEWYFNRWTGNDFNAEKGEEGFQHNILMLSKIIDLCYENNIVPVLVSTPIMDYLNGIFSETGFFETFYRFTYEMKKKYPSLLFFDYSHDEKYSNNWSLFNDPAHLNVTGAKVFTAEIIQNLKDNGLLK